MLQLVLKCCLLSIVSGSGILFNMDSLWRGRIVGGTTAKNGQFSYQVSLRSGVLQSHFCGGFIITNRWIGSAAHCTLKKTAKSVTAVVGVVSRTNGGTKLKLERFESHPEYDNKNLHNDIALIKTEDEIEFTAYVQPIRLGSDNVEHGTKAVTSGWGYTSNPGHAASILQWMTVRIVGNEACKIKMSSANAAKVYESSLCAEPAETGGACMGDSGGPLVAANSVLIGITSWGVPCGLGYPDVFTRIASYHGWIDSVIFT